jgi:hypothetical protein
VFFGSLEPELLEKNKEPEPLGKSQEPFYIFLQFYLTSLQGKEYFAKLNQYSGAGAGRSRVFLAP